MVRRLLFVVGLGLLGGCPASHPDYPTTACTQTSDCYEGEACVSGTCQLVDGGSDGPVDAIVSDTTPAAADR